MSPFAWNAGTMRLAATLLAPMSPNVRLDMGHCLLIVDRSNQVSGRTVRGVRHRVRATMVGATRSAFAPMVSAGFRAAEEGKKLLSTTYRLLTSWLRQIGSRTGGWIPPGHCGAAHVGVGRNPHAFSEHDRVAALADRLTDPLHEFVVRGDVVRRPANHDFVAVDCDPVVRPG